MTNLVRPTGPARPEAPTGHAPAAGPDVPGTGPARPGGPVGPPSAWRRTAARPWAMPYHRLVVLVLAVNVAVLVWCLTARGWSVGDGSALRGTSALVVANLATTVLVRSQHLLNLLYAAAARTPVSWPAAVRGAAARVHHVGGVHAGAALAGAAWLVGFAVLATQARRREAASVPGLTVALAWVLVVLLVLVVVCALPVVRSRAHDLFEQTHRFGGWGSLALFWVLLVNDALHAPDRGPAARALASEWRLWVLLLITVSVALPWVSLRRVPVSVERLSDHAAVVTVARRGRTPIGAACAISLHPLGQWHSFASISTPGRPGFRLLVSRAGDWTGRFVDDPPSHVWVRGALIASPLARVETLYRRVVYVATGSGIGPVLAALLAQRTPTRLVWSVRAPRATYGDALVDEVLAAQPDALVWDTTERGRVDVLPLAQQVVEEFGADAVFVVSNKPTTWRVVEALERTGVRALSPIFDS